jgi:hypothetical protein
MLVRTCVMFRLLSAMFCLSNPSDRISNHSDPLRNQTNRLWSAMFCLWSASFRLENRRKTGKPESISPFAWRTGFSCKVGE